MKRLTGLVATSCILSALAADPPAVPTSFLLPQPAPSSSFQILPTGGLGARCDQGVLDCMALLHAGCDITKPKDYMACVCVARQGGENKCLSVPITEDCRSDTTTRTNAFCEASRVMQEKNLDTFETATPPPGPPVITVSNNISAKSGEEIILISSTRATTGTAVNKDSSTSPPSSASPTSSADNGIVVNPTRTGGNGNLSFKKSSAWSTSARDSGVITLVLICLVMLY